jgi:hypothetical protein
VTTLLAGNVQALFGSCSIAAVHQSLPQSPSAFAQSANDVILTGTKAACEAHIPRSDQMQVGALQSTNSQTRPGMVNSSTGVPSLTKSLQDAGATHAAVAVITGRPLEYPVCSGTMWGDPSWAGGSYPVFPGPSLTFIAFDNPCVNFAAQVTLDIELTGAHCLPYSAESLNMAMFAFLRNGCAAALACRLCSAIQQPDAGTRGTYFAAWPHTRKAFSQFLNVCFRRCQEVVLRRTL